MPFFRRGSDKPHEPRFRTKPKSRTWCPAHRDIFAKADLLSVAEPSITEAARAHPRVQQLARTFTLPGETTTDREVGYALQEVGIAHCCLSTDDALAQLLHRLQAPEDR